MTAADVMPTEEGRTTNVGHLFSLVVRHSWFVGWFVFALGALWDIGYHAPSLLFGVQWPPAVDTVGEFGHVITLVGVVVVIFAVLRKHERGAQNEA